MLTEIPESLSLFLPETVVGMGTGTDLACSRFSNEALRIMNKFKVITRAPLGEQQPHVGREVSGQRWRDKLWGPIPFRASQGAGLWRAVLSPGGHQMQGLKLSGLCISCVATWITSLSAAAGDAGYPWHFHSRRLWS